MPLGRPAGWQTPPTLPSCHVHVDVTSRLYQYKGSLRVHIFTPETPEQVNSRSMSGMAKQGGGNVCQSKGEYISGPRQQLNLRATSLRQISVLNAHQEVTREIDRELTSKRPKTTLVFLMFQRL